MEVNPGQVLMAATDDNPWQVLKKIDVSDKIEKKGKLSYLSWAWAWGQLMDHYPDSSYEFLENQIHEDGSVTVHCNLTVCGKTLPMHLPVMDNKNNAVKNPDSRKISDTKMRCLTKAIAMFGLGHYIYAGEDLPELPPEEIPKNSLNEDQIKYINMLIKADINSPNDYFLRIEAWCFSQLHPEAEIGDAFERGTITKNKSKFMRIVSEGGSHFRETFLDLKKTLENMDPTGFIEIWSEMKGSSKAYFRLQVDDEELKHIKALEAQSND